MLNGLARARLEAFCIKHEIDDHEIDSSISENENMSHLLKFVPEPDIEKSYSKELCEKIECDNEEHEIKNDVIKMEKENINKTPEQEYNELLDEYGYDETRARLMSVSEEEKWLLDKLRREREEERDNIDIQFKEEKKDRLVLGSEYHYLVDEINAETQRLKHGLKIRSVSNNNYYWLIIIIVIILLYLIVSYV